MRKERQTFFTSYFFLFPKDFYSFASNKTKQPRRKANTKLAVRDERLARKFVFYYFWYQICSKCENVADYWIVCIAKQPSANTIRRTK